MTPADKVRENRLRRMAARQGLRLSKSRQRDPRGLLYGVYWLASGEHEPPIEGPGMEGSWPDLDTIERFLNEPRERRSR